MRIYRMKIMYLYTTYDRVVIIYFFAQFLAAKVCCDGYDAVVSVADTGETEERVSWLPRVTNTAKLEYKFWC